MSATTEVGGATTRRAGARPLSRRRGDGEESVGPARAASWAFGAYVAVAGPLLLFVLGSHMWFFRDDFFFLTGREASSLNDLFRPHNGHWSTMPVIVFRGLYALVGLRSYVPYQIPVVIAHLVVVVLLRTVMRRAGVGPWLATAATAALVLFGPGREDIVWAFQIGYTGAILFGLVQLLLADHDGPPDRRDALALLSGAIALLFASTAIVMIIVVGMAMLVRRGWKVAFVQTAPLATLYGLWSAVTHPEVSSPFGRPDPDVVFRWVRSGQTGLFESLGHFAVVGWALAALLVVGLVLALLPGGSPDDHGPSTVLARPRGMATPLALLVGSTLFMVITAQVRWIAGPQAARAGRFLYIGAALTLPALAVAAQAVARRWRMATPALAVLFLVAVPFNIRAFDDDPFGPRYHDHVRDVITNAVRAPNARQAAASVRPIPDPFLSEGLNMGFLRQAADAGKLPSPSGPVPPAVADELAVRLRLSQGSATAIPTQCTWIPPSQNLRADRNVTYVWNADAGAIQVRPVIDGRPTGRFVRLEPSFGTELKGQWAGQELDWQGTGGPRPVRMCRAG